MKKYILGLSLSVLLFSFSFSFNKAIAENSLSAPTPMLTSANSGSITATVSPATPAPIGSVRITTGDINGDGKSDLKLIKPVVILTPAFTSSLKMGSKGDQVKNLQNYLIKKGLLQATSASGTFDSKTNSAVKKFQILNGLPSVGTIGPVSRAKLNELINSSDFNSNSNNGTDSQQSISVGGCRVGKDMINIDVNGNVVVRGKLATAVGLFTKVESYGYGFTLNDIETSWIGSALNSSNTVLDVVIGDTVFIKGKFSLFGMYGGKISGPAVVRDESADCRASVLQGGGDSSVQSPAVSN